MSALQLQVDAPPREVVPVSRPGCVTDWLVRVNERVQRGQKIATFDDGGGPIEITAPCSGRIVAMLHPRLPVNAGGTIAQIEPDGPQEPVKRALPIAPPQHTPPGPKVAPAPSGEALEAPAEVSRRSTLGDADELVKVEELALPTPIKPIKRPRRPRVVKRTSHPTDHQRIDLQALIAALKKEGFDYSAGELDRTMHEVFLGLSRQEQIAALEANRDREIAGRYGYGVGPRG